MLTHTQRHIFKENWYITSVFFKSIAVMTNFEEIIALIIFLPCILCVLVGICSMASYRCTCCCFSNSNSGNNCSTSSNFWYSQQDSRRALAEANYRRLTRDTSTILNLSFDEGRSQVVTEFDFRQSLHMECGVVALEPPPSYTAAMKSVQERTGGQKEAVVGDSHRGLGDESHVPFSSARGEVQANGKMMPKGSPPPYRENMSSHDIHLNVMSVIRSEPAPTQGVDVSSV